MKKTVLFCVLFSTFALSHDKKFKGVWGKYPRSYSSIDIYEDRGRLKASFLYPKLKEAKVIDLREGRKKEGVKFYSGRIDGKDFTLKLDTALANPCLKVEISIPSLQGDLSIHGDGDCLPFHTRPMKARVGTWKKGNHTVVVKERSPGRFLCTIKSSDGFLDFALTQVDFGNSGMAFVEWTSKETRLDDNNTKSTTLRLKFTGSWNEGGIHLKTSGSTTRRWHYANRTTRYQNGFKPYVAGSGRLVPNYEKRTTKLYKYQTTTWKSGIDDDLVKQ